KILETDVNPLVYGELRVPEAPRTILWYAHYDGQPFDARLWKQESAFKPILRDGRMEDGAKEIANFTSLKTYPSGARVYARSASDDKAPIIALLAAIDALRASGQKPKSKDRKSTRLNSSHVAISYAVFCLKKKKKQCLTRIRHVSPPPTYLHTP